MVKPLEGVATNLNHNKKNLECDFASSKEMKSGLLRKEKRLVKDREKKKGSSIKRGRESTFWRNVKAITPNIHWTRIETYGTPGLPDLLGVFKSKKHKRNISFWCELKLTKLNKINLSPFQISWNLKRYSLCKDNFIMAKALEERAIYFYSGGLVLDLASDFASVEPLFVVHQPWTQDLEPALERVLVDVP
tara:strand:- start:450 stop:1022 length:573 start_codon:yes stop_codon:yes gene_type:complete